MTKHIPYFDIKNFWVKNYSKGTYRLGQFWLTLTFKKLGQQAESFYPKYYRLWNEDDPVLAEDMIYEIIDMYDWDLMSVPVVSPELMLEKYV